MRSRFEMEVETAASILKSMASTIERMESYWPASKRGSNASRELEQVKMQRATALQCLIDAQEATNAQD